MSRPIQQIQVFSVQNRRGSTRVRSPYVVRYAIDARHRSKSFRTKAEAERYRVELLKALHAGERFDETTGEPESWLLPLSEVAVHTWTRRWLGSQWTEWQPRTRSSTTESLSRFVALAVIDRSITPTELRRYLRYALRPDRGQRPRRRRLGDVDGAQLPHTRRTDPRPSGRDRARAQPEARWHAARGCHDESVPHELSRLRPCGSRRRRATRSIHGLAAHESTPLERSLAASALSTCTAFQHPTPWRRRSKRSVRATRAAAPTR